MSSSLRALDLFCGAGGASRGLVDAGFDVTGVDRAPQPHYPYRFIQGDALSVDLTGYDFIWASPPCQAYTSLRRRHADRAYVDLVAAVRDRLAQARIPSVIENVPGAPLHDPVLLCGTMFNLRTPAGELWRHRLFECSWGTPSAPAPCGHGSKVRVIGVYGHTGGRELRRVGESPRSTAAERRAVMGIDWMNRDELSQAIPPAYASFLARSYRIATGEKP